VVGRLYGGALMQRADQNGTAAARRISRATDVRNCRGKGPPFPSVSADPQLGVALHPVRPFGSRQPPRGRGRDRRVDPPSVLHQRSLQTWLPAILDAIGIRIGNQMSGQRVERRLAAILAVDVAGYSRMMGEDEEGTLAALGAVRREVGDPKIADHRGRIVKTTGDGLLIEFASVVEAVRCAVEVQREMRSRNDALPPDRRIAFRMGINVGDIIIEDGDIFGDGVNIAARLESLAEPGGICLSAAAHEQVRDRLDIAFEDRGDQQVKNIARPVRTYVVVLSASSRATTPAAPIRVLPDKPSIVVLHSRIFRATPSKNISPMGWSRRSSPCSVASAGCS
jgi:class 3 adenylate cyclase